MKWCPRSCCPPPPPLSSLCPHLWSCLWIGEVKGWNQNLSICKCVWVLFPAVWTNVAVRVEGFHGVCLLTLKTARKWKSKGGVFLISSLTSSFSFRFLCSNDLTDEPSQSVTWKPQRIITVLVFHLLARLLQRPWPDPCWQRFPVSWWTSSTPWSWSHQTPAVLQQKLWEQPDPV